MRASSLLAVLLLAPPSSADQPPRPVPRPGLSWAEAESLNRKLEAIEKQRGRLVNRDGFGSIVWEDVRVNAWSLPISLLEQMVASATKKPDNPEGYDISAPFRLPYSVRRVRLELGRALLEF